MARAGVSDEREAELRLGVALGPRRTAGTQGTGRKAWHCGLGDPGQLRLLVACDGHYRHASHVQRVAPYSAIAMVAMVQVREAPMVPGPRQWPKAGAGRRHRGAGRWSEQAQLHRLGDVGVVGAVNAVLRGGSA